MKIVLKAPGTQRLKPKHDDLLSNVGFKFNLRRYDVVWTRDPRPFLQCGYDAKRAALGAGGGGGDGGAGAGRGSGRGLHSFTFQLN
jgi:hypothetical protein